MENVEAGENVNRTDNITLTVINILIMCSKLIRRIVPLFSNHLTDTVICCGHSVTVSIGHFLKSAVTVFVGVFNQVTVCLTVNTNTFKVMESIVFQNII